MLEALIARWGYLAILGGTFLEGETILLAGGAMAHRGLLSLPLVIACAFAASFLGDQGWFFAGRRYGPGLIARRPSWSVPAERVRQWLTRYGAVFVLAFRFIYGIRILTPVLLGANGYPASRFVPLNALGAAIWSTAVASVGWAVGEGLTRALGRAGKVEERLLAVIVFAIVVALTARHWTQRRKAKLTEETSR
jgi:membrane protein DedA with SNARE-associated domain